MGNGASKSPEYGVHVNPRVDYAEELGKKAGQVCKKWKFLLLTQLYY
jgi:hypothetical protein